jgi:hypothetical protein
VNNEAEEEDRISYSGAIRNRANNQNEAGTDLKLFNWNFLD